MPTTELSCNPSTNRRSPGRSVRSVISVEPGFAKIVVRSSSRRTSKVASRTVRAVTVRDILEIDDRSERELPRPLARGLPLPFGPELELPDSAEVAAVRRGLEPAERSGRLL